MCRLYLTWTVNKKTLCAEMKHFKLVETYLKARRATLPFLILLCTTVPARAQNTLAVKPENATPGAASLYQFEFALPDSLPRLGAVSLRFPVSIDVSGVTVAASSTIKGGLQVSVQDNEVLVTRRGEGGALRAGSKVDLFLSVIKNPPDTASNLKLVARVHTDARQALAQLRSKTPPAAADAKAIEGTFSIPQPE